MKIEFSQQIFEKYQSINFHEKPSSGSRVARCGQTDRPTDRQTDGQTDGQTDMTKLIVAFRNSANTHEDTKKY